MTEAFERAMRTRIQAIADTSEATRQKLAQHLTPPEVATLAAGMFSDAEKDLACLDLGGGTGILSVALLERSIGQKGSGAFRPLSRCRLPCVPTSRAVYYK